MKNTFHLPDGGHLSYSVEGDGPPLLLVAGLGGMASFWRQAVTHFSPHFTVISYDHRGTGASSRCDRPYSVRTMAEDVQALSDHLDLSNPVLVGHSTGGAIGQYLGAVLEFPMKALVLSGTFARPCHYFRSLFTARMEVLHAMGPDAYRRFSSLFQYPPYWFTEQKVVVDGTGEPPLDTTILERRIHAILEHDTLDVLQNIAIPTLVIGAEDDVIVPAYHSRQIAELIPQSELVVLPRGGHYFPNTERDAFHRALERFLVNQKKRAA